MSRPDRRAALSTSLAVAAAALVVVVALVVGVVLFGWVLSRYGFGAFLLAAIALLLIVGAVVDWRRKRQGEVGGS